MANITELIKNIRNAIYGKDVRENIAGAIEQCYEDASKSGNANMEVLDARGIYDTLKKRLDNSDNVKANKTVLEAEIRTRISGESNLQNQINGLASGSPLVASTVSEMTDTSRVYVNTTDGHWYYYNGSTWIDGGVYQATEVDNGAIDILKLDELLKNNFIKEYENINLDFKYQGYCGVDFDTNKLKITEESSYSYSVTNLEKDKIYDFSGFNMYNVLLGLVVVDSQNENEVVYSTVKPGASNTYSVSTVFKPNKEGLKAYITTCSYFSLFAKNNVYLNEISNISLNYLKNNVNEIKTVYNALMHISTEIGKNPVNQIYDSENYFYKIYKLSKGTKYKIKSFNTLFITGLVLTDENLITTYSSSTTQPEQIEYFEYEFIAKNDGFAFLSFYNNATSSIEILNDFNNQNRFINKKWSVMGDSLTARSTLGQNVKNYTDYVSDKLGLISTNYGHGGSGYRARSNYNEAFYQIADTLDSDTDLITIFGSFNDVCINPLNYGTVEDNTTDTTFGCMNITLDKLINNYPNAVIGVIIPTPWGGINDYSVNKENANNYINGLIEICKKKSIPYLDLYHESNLAPWNENNANLYFHGTSETDTTHPNTLGHKRFSPQIIDFINKLLY